MVKRAKHKKESVESSELEAELDKRLPETRETMDAVVTAQKSNKRKGWFFRRFLPGAAAAAIVGGAHQAYLHEPLKNVAQIVIYTADASNRLGRAAYNLGEQIVGSGGRGSRFEKAQKEFESADRDYFESMKDLMSTYQQNLNNRKHMVDEMKNAVEGFGRIAKKAPGYEGFTKTEIPNLRDRIHSLMIGLTTQTNEELANRMSKEYSQNYDELLKMLNEADRAKSIKNEDILKIAERLGRVSKGLEQLNSDDEKELTNTIKEVNDLYSLGQRMRELETGQIRTKDVAYRELTEMGKKYGLDANRPEDYATIIAYAAGVLLAGLAYKFGSKIGSLVIPSRDVDLNKVSRSYLEKKIRSEMENKKKSGRHDLEDKVITGVVLFFPLLLLPYLLNFTGFVFIENFFNNFGLFSNYIVLIWFFLLVFMVFRKVYKKRNF